ncbi:MAG: hypothetical protein E7627_08500 [Ruminococcaceae bacterium]|nr:hypothetical protein [Oscillospiraceae bacterium]
MLKKLVELRKPIILTLIGALLISLILYIIFGDGEDTVMVLVGTLIMPFIIYGFFRLMFKVVEKNAPVTVLNFFVWFFLIAGFFGIVMMFVGFISNFPSAPPLSLACCVGLVAGALAEAKKNLDQFR